MDIALKIKIFLWQLSYNAPPSEKSLTKKECRLILNVRSAYLTLKSPTTFLETIGTTKIWEKAQKLECLTETPNTHITTWIRELGAPKGFGNKEEQVMASTLLWSLWEIKNNIVFRDVAFNTNEVLIRAISMIRVGVQKHR